ncbi:hypothetical protein L3X38_037604 [Prunus dulcis]|uniref:Uncharacterized protein n=1 Tax=Prunus dulcis TaxID=3755 RepID=A0AAD4V5V1_PRUDU|nr:hypothetical protein L3X38_037604 [Prunus dulcis]
MRFVSLLEMKCGKLSHSMCRFLVDKLNPSESSIVLHGKILKISVDNFIRIMGVKDGGEEVDFTGSMDEQQIVKLRNSFLVGKKLLKNNELKQIIMGTEEGQLDLGKAKHPKNKQDKQGGTPNEQGDNVKGFANLDKTLAPSVEVIVRGHAK